MDNELDIKVSMTPHPWDNPTKPYSWVLLKWCKTAWCNVGHGWAKTPVEAWKEAFEYYNWYIIEHKAELEQLDNTTKT